MQEADNNYWRTGLERERERETKKGREGGKEKEREGKEERGEGKGELPAAVAIYIRQLVQLNL